MPSQTQFGFRSGLVRCVLVLAIMCCSLTAVIANPEFESAYQRLSSPNKAEQQKGFESLKSAGFAGAKWLSERETHSSNRVNELRAQLVLPYLNRLRWQSMSNIHPKVLGKLTGFGLLLRRKILSGELDVRKTHDGGLQIHLKLSGQYQDDAGDIESTSRYDKNLQLVFSEFSVHIEDTKTRKVSLDEKQTWQRLAILDSHKARFRVVKNGASTPSVVVVGANVTTIDMALVLGRSLAFNDKKLRTWDLSILNPESNGLLPGQLVTVRREKVVSLGGGRQKGLRIEAQSESLPKALRTMRVWIDADQKPIKARIGPVSVYARSIFKANDRPLSADECVGVLPKTKPVIKPAKKREFF